MDVTPGEAAQRERAEMLKRVSREMAQIQKQAFGKGPRSTKSYLFDDLLLIVMREGLTQAEHTMLRFGQADLVRSFRQQFQNEMEAPLTEMVERDTGHKVLAYQSQILFNPDVVVEIFIFDRAGDGFVSAEAPDDDDDDVEG